MREKKIKLKDWLKITDGIAWIVVAFPLLVFGVFLASLREFFMLVDRLFGVKTYLPETVHVILICPLNGLFYWWAKVSGVGPYAKSPKSGKTNDALSKGQ